MVKAVEDGERGRNQMRAGVGAPEPGEARGSLHDVQPAGRDERERARQSAVYIADCE